jgi:hypothetical protein
MGGGGFKAGGAGQAAGGVDLILPLAERDHRGFVLLATTGFNFDRDLRFEGGLLFKFQPQILIQLAHIFSKIQ